MIKFGTDVDVPLRMNSYYFSSAIVMPMFSLLLVPPEVGVTYITATQITAIKSFLGVIVLS